MGSSPEKTERIDLKGLILPGPPVQEAVGTYPGIGVMSELVDGFAECVGLDQYLIPPRGNNLKSLDLGVQHSPEGACLPFKLIMGNLMESLGRGANTVGMMTERGPCRLGFYSLAMRLIFSDLGLGNGWLEFNNASLSKGYVKYFRENFRRTSGKDVSLPVVLWSFVVGFARLSAVEALEKQRNALLVFEVTPGSVNDCFTAGRKLIRQARSVRGIRQALRQAQRRLRRVPVDRTRETVRVVITGEVYCVVDPFANCNIETRLAKLGAQPLRQLWQKDFVRHIMHLDHFQKNGRRAANRAARRYLPEDLGGDCNSNVGFALLAHQYGDDGMVHLKPFGCMLEFVAENLLEAVGRETGLPILSLTLDDLTAEERINVRLEAFVDNLFRRKRQSGRGKA